MKLEHVLQMSAMEDTNQALSPGATLTSMTANFRRATQSKIQRGIEKLKSAELLVMCVLVWSLDEMNKSVSY